MASQQSTCLQCGQQFTPTRARQRFCSRSCSSQKRGKSQAITPVQDADRALCVIWCAGFFEGEGSISLTPRYSRYDPSGRGRHVRISAYQKYRGPLERLAATFGGRIHPDRDRGWTWNLEDERAIVALQQMVPWLILKTQRAEDVFLWQTTMRRGLRWHPRTEEEIALRNAILVRFGHADQGASAIPSEANAEGSRPSRV
jgi:hypothetical protein